MNKNKIKNSPRDATNEASGFHRVTRVAMSLCRWAGLFPVAGLGHPTKERLRCTFKSPYSVYCVATVAGQLFTTVLCIYSFVVTNVTLTNLSMMIFSVIGCISTMLMLRLSFHWPELVNKVTSIEYLLPCRKYDSLVRKCNLTTIVILILAFVEHLLSLVFLWKHAMNCHEQTPSLESFAVKSYSYVFRLFKYKAWIAILAECISIQATFLWSFTDIFIIVLSQYVTAHFDELNKVISLYKERENTEWGHLRIEYSYLVQIVRLIDSRVSSVILVSFFTNLFFICLQLFNILNRGYSAQYHCNPKKMDEAMSGIEHGVYYTYSFLFLVLRALSVSLFTAEVNSTAQFPIFELFDVPASAYSIDVQRFHRQVSYTTVAFSGLNFFYVTRKMLLKVVGAIVTYELVMLQFNKAQNEFVGYTNSTIIN